MSYHFRFLAAVGDGDTLLLYLSSNIQTNLFQISQYVPVTELAIRTDLPKYLEDYGG